MSCIYISVLTACRLIKEKEMDVNVSVTVMEIYNEKIKDLLLERPVSYNIIVYIGIMLSFHDHMCLKY